MPGRRIDLHTHSTASDGTTTPEALVGEAKGVWLYAVLWPPAAELVLLEHVVLHDLRDDAHTAIELPFGAPSPRLTAA